MGGEAVFTQHFITDWKVLDGIRAGRAETMEISGS